MERYALSMCSIHHCYVCTIKQLYKCSPRRLSIVLYMLESSLRIRITYTDHMMQMFYCSSPAAAAEPWLNSRKCWKASTVDTNCLHIFACMEHSWICSTLNGVYHWSMHWKAIANFLPCHHNSPGKTKQNVWQIVWQLLTPPILTGFDLTETACKVIWKGYLIQVPTLMHAGVPCMVYHFSWRP